MTQAVFMLKKAVILSNSCITASGAEVAVKKEQASGKSGKGKGKKRGRSKAFDSVLEKEDIEGPIVVTSAGNDGQSPLNTKDDPETGQSSSKMAM